MNPLDFPVEDTMSVAVNDIFCDIYRKTAILSSVLIISEKLLPFASRLFICINTLFLLLWHGEILLKILQPGFYSINNMFPLRKQKVSCSETKNHLELRVLFHNAKNGGKGAPDHFFICISLYLHGFFLQPFLSTYISSSQAV